MKKSKISGAQTFVKLMGRQMVDRILDQPYMKKIVLLPDSEFLLESLKAVNCNYVWNVSDLGLSTDESAEKIVRAIKRVHRADNKKRGFVLITRNLKPFKNLVSKEFDVVVIPVARPDENFMHNLKSILVLSVSLRGPSGVLFSITRTRCKGSGGFQVDPVRIARKRRP